jgi:hypothetical protein
MDLSFSPAIESFREEVRRFLREELPDDIRAKVAEERMDLSKEDQRRWHKILYRRGWAAPGWPKEHGGCAFSDQQHYVFERELALAGAPRPLIYGIQMLGPCLIAFGTDAQKERFLPGILSGDVFWCQGFSEPNAGSDLASLRCRAERDGDEYVINGSKLWTSEAHIADFMFGLFRTDASGKKQQGITFLMLDMRSPGVAVHPLICYDGSHEVNQVFFEDVRVPIENRLGEEGKGWGIAKHLLGLERFGTAEVSRSMASFNRLLDLADQIGVASGTLAEESWFADELALIEVELRALELTEQRFLFRPAGEDAPGPEASMLKIRGTEVQQRILELAMQALGYYAHVDVGSLEASAGCPAGPRAARYAAKAYFNYRKTSIYSGSNEIQKNIISKFVLGL